MKINKLLLFAEQAFFSFNNFLLILVLSSLQDAIDFKNWSILHIIIMLGVGLNNTIINQSYQVFINKYYQYYLKKNYLMTLHLFLIINSLIFSFLTIFVNVGNKIDNILISFFIIFLLSMYELQRRIFIISSNNLFILKTTSFILISLNVSLLICSTIIELNYEKVYMIYFAVLSIVVVLSSFKIFNLYKISLQSFKRIQIKLLLTVFLRHFRFSRSLILGMFFFWVYTQGFLLIIEEKLSIKEFNSLRVILNFINFSSILLLVFDNYYMSRQTQLYKQNIKLFINQYKSLINNFFILYTVYIISFSLFAWLLFDFIYLKYSEYKIYLIYLFFAQLIYGFSRPFIMYIKINEKNHFILLSHFLAALIILSLIPILTTNLNFFNVVILIVISYSLFTLSTFLSYNLLKRKLI